MNLYEIVNKLDKSEYNEDWIDIENITNELNINNYFYDIEKFENEKRLRCYWLFKWICTDTFVGGKLYFFDNDLIAYSYQSSRKDSENFSWISEEKYKNLKEYIKSLILIDDSDHIEIFNPNEEEKIYYKIYYNSQLIPDEHYNKCFYNGEKVTIINHTTLNFANDFVKIRLSNGEDKKVKIQELEFKFNLID